MRGAYNDGLDVLGAATLGPRGTGVHGDFFEKQRLDEAVRHAEILGATVREWDNHNTYAPDDVVYFQQKYWRALRDVTPPLIPAFQSGNVPGQSDAWREVSEASVYARTEHVGDTYGNGVAQRAASQELKRPMRAIDRFRIANKRVVLHGDDDELGFDWGQVAAAFGMPVSTDFTLDPSRAFTSSSSDNPYQAAFMHPVAQPLLHNLLSRHSAAGGGRIAQAQARARAEMLGLNPSISDWDKTTAYNADSVVRYWGSYYRATKDVGGASVLWGNDAPDKSDAWIEVPASTVIYGEDEAAALRAVDEIFGMFDIGSAQIKMNGLKPVSVGAARALVHGGQQVMSVADMVAKQKDLPGQTARDGVVGHLQWHQNKLAGLHDDKAIYDSGDDAKKWVTQAFIESNAVETGAQYIDEAWTKMWVDIATAQSARELAVAAYHSVADAAGRAADEAKSVITWTMVIIGGVVAIVGYGVYKILSGQTGAAIAGAATHHYLGGRR